LSTLRSRRRLPAMPVFCSSGDETEPGPDPS
jgi:hypothetical protein